MASRNQIDPNQLPTDSSNRSKAAKRAWEMMNSAVYKARKTARLSQEALRTWSGKDGYHCIFLDAPSGYPRTGIVDALLVRIAKSNPDVVEIHLVQLKGGGAGLTPIERTRLIEATGSVRVGAAVAMWDRNNMSVDFLATPGSSDSGPERPRKKQQKGRP